MIKEQGIFTEGKVMNIIKKIFAPVDMTCGTPWKKIAIFAIPMLLGNIAQQTYSAVDSVVVGKYVGDNALAAVGSAGPIMNLLIVLFVGISVGVSIMVSQYFGARNREELSVTIGNCITVIGIASLVIMVLSLFITRPLLELLGTPESIIDWSEGYLLIIFLGAAAGGYYNILSGVLRGLGDSVSALLYLLVSCVTNIILDIVFVKYVGMGVNGVALATVIAQGVSALLCLNKLFRMKEYFDLNAAHLKLSGRHVRQIFELGIPSGITQAIISLSMIVVQALSNSFGETFIAANVMVQRVDGFAMLPAFSFGMAMTTFAGQNVGANRMDRVDQGTRQGTILAVSTSAGITVILLAVGRFLMSIFTNTPSLVDLGMRLLTILAFGYPMMAITQSLFGIMRGAGDTMTPMWLSTLQTVVLRVPMAYLLVYLTRSPEYPKGREECIFISLVVTWTISAAMNFGIFKLGRWKKKAFGAE